MRRVTKLFNTKATSIDSVNKTVRFQISDNQADRMGEVVDQKTWNLKDYMLNPIVLFGHDPSQPENVLGTAQSLDTSKDGSGTFADIRFDTDINPKANLVFNQVERGTLRTVSVGFINHTEEMENDVPVLKDNDLLEISIVPIPANPRAIALALKEGTINRKDANWLVESMSKEIAFVEKHLEEEDNNDKDNHTMDEQTTKQLSALLEAVTALTASQAETNKRLDALTDGLTEKAADMHDDADATTKDLLDDAGGDDPTPPAPETPFADPPADPKDDDPKDKPEDKPKDDPAKGGEPDQPGAGTPDEIELDAELTPELEARIDKQLEEAVVST